MGGLNVAAERLRVWRERPDVMVEELFHVKPDAWQRDVLRAFPERRRIAMTACKGPGKTAVLAWLGWNFMLTRPHPKVAATSVTKDNLGDNLWPEFAKWQKRSELLSELFTWTKTRITCNESPETWFMSARSWSKSASPQEQSDTLAGLHSDYILFILDESGGIPDAVMASAEAALASGIECRLVQAGNPTRLDGPLYRAATNERDLWYVVHITGDPNDPKRSPRVSEQWAEEQIRKYGAENPWVLVNVFGRFPPASLNTLIGPDDVRAAMGRHIPEEQYIHAAKVLGVDVARFGDDASVIFPRQGIVVFEPTMLRSATSIVGAGVVNRLWGELDCDACFVDGTGGYGAGWIDALSSLGRGPIDVQFAGSATDGKFYNKRAQMYWDMCEAIKRGTSLPMCEELVADLTTPTYTFKNDKILIEEKDQIKDRIGRSPDWGDALACTYAFPIQARERNVYSMAGRRAYRPFEILA